MRKSLITLLIFLATVAWWIPAQWNLLEARRAWQDSQARLTELRNRLANDQAALASAQREEAALNRSRNETAAALNAARSDLVKTDPESQWANPPAMLPDWNPNSPYVWVSKTFLKQLQPPVFERNGGITREAADFLALDELARRALNEQLELMLADYQALQVSNAEVSVSPAEVSQTNRLTLTIQIPSRPDQHAVFDDQIARILRQNLGDQRAGLINDAGQNWANIHTLPTTLSIAVTRRPDGTFQMATPAGQARLPVPDYLLPLLTGVFSQTEDSP